MVRATGPSVGLKKGAFYFVIIAQNNVAGSHCPKRSGWGRWKRCWMKLDPDWDYDLMSGQEEWVLTQARAAITKARGGTTSG